MIEGAGQRFGIVPYRDDNSELRGRRRTPLTHHALARRRILLREYPPRRLVLCHPVESPYTGEQLSATANFPRRYRRARCSRAFTAATLSPRAAPISRSEWPSSSLRTTTALSTGAN